MRMGLALVTVYQKESIIRYYGLAIYSIQMICPDGNRLRNMACDVDVTRRRMILRHFFPIQKPRGDTFTKSQYSYAIIIQCGLCLYGLCIYSSE